MKKSILLLILISFVSNASLSQTWAERKQAKKERIEAQFLKTKALVKSGSFQFEAKWANPLGNDAVRIGQSLPGGVAVFQGNRVNLTGNSNFVKINQSQKADIFLPFFGRVFFPSRINNQGGITHNGKITDYSFTVNDKKKIITVKFNAKSQDDNLKLVLRISSGGTTILNVNSNNRQNIAYDGLISELSKEE